MTSLPHHVSNLILSQRLKELGVPQKSLFRWTNEQLGGLRTNGYKWQVGFRPNPFPSDYESYSAFLSSELGELLPEGYVSAKELDVWLCDKYENLKTWAALRAEADTEADARAKMLIHLLETGIVKNDV